MGKPWKNHGKMVVQWDLMVVQWEFHGDFTGLALTTHCQLQLPCSTFQLPAETLKSYTFLLKCCDPPSAIGAPVTVRNILKQV